MSSEQSRAAETLVVFDFDWSLADQDTDRWIFEVLKPQYRKELKQLKTEEQWTDLCARYLVKLHEDGFTQQQVEDAMRKMPFHPAVTRAITTFKETHDARFLILSNSNNVYIDLILKEQGLENFFEDIITNKARFLSNGCLELKRRVAADDPKQHGCKIGCSPNMCKGEELEAFVKKNGGFEAFRRIIYVGDGGNDFCPILRLRSQDVAFVRNYRGLEKRIEKDGTTHGLKCEIKKWAGSWEMEQLFLAEDA